MPIPYINYLKLNASLSIMSLTCSFQSLILPSSLNETDGTASSPLGLLLAQQTKLIDTCAVILLPICLLRP